MSQKNNTHRFILRVSVCLFTLLFGFSLLTESASMQDEKEIVVTSANITNSANYRSMANYRPTPEPPKTIVRGRVFYAESGRPVKRSVLMLMSDVGGSPGEATALTDGDGNFEIKNVRAGVYYAMVNAPGVVSPMAFADFSRMRGGGEKEAFEKAFEHFERIVVPEGGGQIEVQIAARRGGAIGGRVMYDDGDPAIGVKVEILRKADGKYSAVIPNFSAMASMFIGGGAGFQTDDRGVYRLAGLPPGEYVVKVTENASHNESADERSYMAIERLMLGGGSSFLNIFYPDAPDAKSAQIINLELGQEASEINLTLPARNLYKLAGRVVASDGKSPVKAQIKIEREGDDDVFSLFGELSRRVKNVTTDEKGNWNFKELPKGNYKIIVEPLQNGGRAQEEYEFYDEEGSGLANVNAGSRSARNEPPKPKYAKKIQEIKLEDRDLSEIVVELGLGATVSGTVSVENSRELPNNVSIVARKGGGGELSVTDSVSNNQMPMPGMSNVMRRTNSNPALTKPKPDNDFKLENVPAGKTYFYIHHDENFYVKSAKADGLDLLAGAVELKDGDAIKNVQIVLSKEVGIFKGKIVDENNAPLKNGDFILVPTDTGKQKNSTYFRNVRADAAGEFEKKVAPGEYAIVFLNPESGEDGKYEEFFKMLAEAVKDAQKITIEAGKTEKLTVKKTKK